MKQKPNECLRCGADMVCTGAHTPTFANGRPRAERTQWACPVCKYECETLAGRHYRAGGAQ